MARAGLFLPAPGTHGCPWLAPGARPTSAMNNPAANSPPSVEPMCADRRILPPASASLPQATGRAASWCCSMRWAAGTDPGRGRGAAIARVAHLRIGRLTLATTHFGEVRR